MLSINPHVAHVKESATLWINQTVRQKRSQGEDVAHFGFGQSPFPVPQLIQEALQAHAGQKDYLPTCGLPALCEAIAQFYQKRFQYSFTADSVCVGPGSKELLFQLIYLLEGPLIIPAPSWVSYGPQAALRGKTIAPVPTQREKGYRIQAEELDQACYALGDQQKLLILNSPSNPTGSCHRPEELQALAEVCRANRVIVLSDEIYSMTEFGQASHTSLAYYYPEGTIVSGGLSKSFSAGGYRFGLVLIPPELELAKKALMSFISETFSAVSAPIQYAALAAYEHFDQLEPELQRCAEIHGYAGNYLHQRFVDMGLNCPKPEGAFYLFPDFDNYRDALKQRGLLTGEALCQTLLEEAKVALLPASDFYLPSTHLGVRAASVDYDGVRVLQEFPGAEKMTSDFEQSLFPNLVDGCDRLQSFLQTL